MNDPLAVSVTGEWGADYLSNKMESTPGNFARLKEAEITANRCGFVKQPITSDSDKPCTTYKLQFSESQLNGKSRLNYSCALSITTIYAVFITS